MEIVTKLNTALRVPLTVTRLTVYCQPTSVEKSMQKNSSEQNQINSSKLSLYCNYNPPLTSNCEPNI